MARIVSSRLIQASPASPGTEDTEKIKNAMIERQVSMIEEVRRVWQLFRDRRPETYADMSKVLP